MSELAILILLYAVGVFLLLAEIFIPSYGILSVAALGFLITAVVKTFGYGREAGIVAMCACLVLIPVFAYLAIKYWHRTPIGRRISPPNPVFTAEDSGVPGVELHELVGQVGRSVSTLRPVGICEFNGRRVTCVAEYGMVEAQQPVEGTGVRGNNLVVVERKT
jgi:membrane-bound serine protease (ClpP class)